MAKTETPPYEATSAQLKEEIERALAEYATFEADCPRRLQEAIRYVLLGPGKRIRPILTLCAAEACGGTTAAALPAACAVEMVHAYSLVHDDLPAMDDDDLRRGRPTCHVVYDEALAILVGDALLSRAFEILATELPSPDITAACCAALGTASGATALVGGQAADLAGPSASADLQELEAIHRRKTGALINCALQLGALAARATDEERETLRGYGQRLGLAFQILDDLLDVQGDEQRVGKRLGKDQDKNKLTFPSLLGIQESRERAERLVEECIALVAPWGARASGLETLARYVLERNH